MKSIYGITIRRRYLVTFHSQAKTIDKKTGAVVSLANRYVEVIANDMDLAWQEVEGVYPGQTSRAHPDNEYNRRRLELMGYTPYREGSET